MTNSIKKNYAYSSAYQVLNIIIPLITTPYLSRVIGAEGNGLYTYTYSVASLFNLFAQLGLSNYGVREIASCKEDRVLRSKTFWNIFCMNLISGGLVSALYALYCMTLGNSYYPLCAIWALMIVGSTIDVTWMLNGCQEFKVPTIRNFCTRLASMVFILLFVRDSGDVWAYVLAIAAPTFINALCVWPFVTRYVDFSRPEWREMRRHLKPNLVLFIPIIATSVYNLLDSFMLGSIGDMKDTGYYNYASRITQIPLAFITALGSVVLPKMTEVIAGGRIAEAKGLVRETMWFMEAAAMAFSWGVVAVAPEFVPVFFGPGFDECVILIAALAPTIPLVSATNVMGVQYLVPSRRDRDFTASVVTGATVNFLLNLFVIPQFGAFGASLSTVAAELTVLLVQVWLVHGELEVVRYLREAVPFILIGLIMMLGVRGLAAFLSTIGMGLTVFTIIIEFIAGALLYLGMSAVWVKVSHNQEFKNLLPELARRFGI